MCLIQKVFDAVLYMLGLHFQGQIRAMVHQLVLFYTNQYDMLRVCAGVERRLVETGLGAVVDRCCFGHWYLSLSAVYHVCSD